MFYCIGFTVADNNPLSILLKKAKEEISKRGNAVISGRIDLQKAFTSLLSSLNTEKSTEYEHAIAANTLNYIIGNVLNGFIKNENSGKTNISMKESLIYYIASYLKNNVYQIDALSRLSEDTGYSYSYISHLFSKKMGQSLKDYFSMLRMNTATELLKEKSVTKVSEMMGYSSVQAFTRAYKTACKTSPGQINGL